MNPATTATESPADIEARLRTLIEAEEDVKRLIKLKALPDGQWRYQIETPFKTFPKFVIGVTDSEFEKVGLLHKCGAEWSSDAEWEKLEETLL